VFATGYGETSLIPNELGHVPIVRKPYDITALMGALTTAMGKQ
jgi:hypothetical protein